MPTIVFLHGFGNAGNCSFSRALAAAFPENPVLAPDLSPDPRVAVDQIAAAIDEARAAGETEFHLIGVSLGGFYAGYFSALCGYPATMVNPAFDPETRAASRVGVHRNHNTGEVFTFEASYLETLARLRAPIELEGFDPGLVRGVVALDDEVIPPGDMLAYFEGHGVPVDTFTDQGHRFKNVGALVPVVRSQLEGAARCPRRALCA